MWPTSPFINGPFHPYTIYAMRSICPSLGFAIDENKMSSFTSTDPSINASVDASPPSVVVSSFEDTTNSVTVGVAPTSQRSAYIGSVDQSLDAFFRRPVQVAQINWSTTVTPTAYDIWSLWATNTAVARKLSNYTLFRGTMHVSVTVNGSPVQYGALLVAYAPGAAATVPSSGVASTWVSFGQRFSQLRHFIINPAGTARGQLVIPFFYQYPYANIVLGTDWAKIGRLVVGSLVGLTNVNGTAVQNCTVTIMAWMEDVELVVPTSVAVGPDGPGKDEYKRDGSVSGPASALASFAGKLRNAPIIGAYATAAEMASNAVASVARLFGFSRPSLISDPIFQSPLVVGPLSIVEGADPSLKLSVDPKQQLGIGYGDMGLPSQEDPLSISSIAMRECLQNDSGITWSTTHAAGTILGAAAVNPTSSCHADSTVSVFCPTPLAYVAQPFQYWTGSIIYRVRPILSPLMTGRLLIWHWPHNNLGYLTVPTSDVLNTLSNCILDVSSCTDQEFRIGMVNSRTWLKTGNWDDAGTITEGINNGFIVIQVLNELVAPAACTSTILLSVRGGEDFSVAGPMLSRAARYTYSTAGPDEISAATISAPGTAVLCDLQPGVVPPERYLNYFGEQITSFRQMAKRYSLWFSANLSAAGALTIGDVIYWSLILPSFPYPPTNAASEQTMVWTWPAYAALPFRGMRGGSRYKSSFHQSTAFSSISLLSANRYCYATAAPSGTYDTAAKISHGLDATLYRRSADGAAWSDVRSKPAQEIEVPYQHNLLFSVPGSAGGTNEDLTQISRLELTGEALLNATTTTLGANAFGVWVVAAAAADDFSVFEFCGVGSFTLDPDKNGSSAYGNAVGIGMG